MRMCYFWVRNSSLVLNKIFFVQAIIISFLYPFVLLIAQSLKKSCSGSRVMRMHHLWPQISSFALNKILFGKNHYHFDLAINPFHDAKLTKKFLQWIQSYEDSPFLGLKWPIYLLVNLALFIHAFLYAKIKVRY